MPLVPHQWREWMRPSLRGQQGSAEGFRARRRSQEKEHGKESGKGARLTEERQGKSHGGLVSAAEGRELCARKKFKVSKTL